MGIVAALKNGCSSLRGVWRYIALAYTINVVLALPLAATVGLALQDSLKDTVAADNLRLGWDDLWYQGFAAEAKGLAASFDPSVTGIGAVFNALDAQFSGGLVALPTAIAWTALAYLVVWVFLGGGFLARFCGQSRGPFLGDAARHFPKLLLISGVGWGVALALLEGLLPALGRLVASLTYDTIDERVDFAWTVGRYAVVWGLMWALNLVVDYAKISLVSGHCSAVPRALASGGRLALGNVRRVFGLSASLISFAVVVVVAYWVIAPGGDQANGFSVAMAFAISQTYVLAKIGLRCLGWAAHSHMGTALLDRDTVG